MTFEERKTSVVKGLRELADRIDSVDNEIALPCRFEYEAITFYTLDEKVFVATVKALGGGEKVFTDGYVTIKNTIEGINVKISLLSKVCELKQVGVKKVTKDVTPDKVKVTKVVEEPVYEHVCPDSILNL